MQKWRSVCVLGLMLCACTPQNPLSSPTRVEPTHTTRIDATDPPKSEPTTPKVTPVAKLDPMAGIGAPMKRPASWRRGVALGLFASPDTTPAEQRALYATFLDEIVAVGATDLSLVARWSQKTITSSKIARDPKMTVSDEMLSWVISQARERGLRIFLMPYIYLQVRGRGKWRGTLAPASPKAWWESYDRFILHYAALATRHKVDLFSVGSELLSMEPEEKRWRSLIKRVRKVFPGKLTYSANWDHFEIPPYWDALDVVGMTAYQELSKEKDPTLKQLAAGWGTFRRRLGIWARENQKKVIFTEIGYPSHTTGVAYPWNYTADSPPDARIQGLGFRTMFDVWHDSPTLEGLYVWNWFGPRGPKHSTYSPRGKVSETILRHWYTGSTK